MPIIKKSDVIYERPHSSDTNWVSSMLVINLTNSNGVEGAFRWGNFIAVLMVISYMSATPPERPLVTPL